ncbi:hypothetical protein QD460_34310, partial [Rhizobium jaguaris]|uniref:hypothetical protein n=1 Tax=Rhizobium jaguaris TaxID=1312183 RepID=UPI0039BFF3B3
MKDVDSSDEEAVYAPAVVLHDEASKGTRVSAIADTGCVDLIWCGDLGIPAKSTWLFLWCRQKQRLAVRDRLHLQ